jgi:hypothetical protein
VELVITATIDLAEPSADGGFITWIHADVARGDAEPDDDSADDAPAASLGQIRVALIHVGKIEESGGDLLEVLDADSGDLEALHHLYFDEEGDFLEEFAQGAGPDLLYVAGVHIAEAWRGHGVELAIVRRLCDTLGTACELAVVTYTEPAEAEAWLRMGFEVTRAPESGACGYLHLALAFRHPRVVEAEDGERFRVVPNPGPPEQHH